MFFVGIDLSGPSNSQDTALAAFKVSKKGSLVLCHHLIGADDGDILYSANRFKLEGDVVVGLDAPLSYNIGGGDRPSDADLRRRIVAAGLKPGSVMPPTMTRMVYLTLRGISVARSLLSTNKRIKIVEVHPGAAMALRGAPVRDVTGFKSDTTSRHRLLMWLERQGLKNISRVENPTDHYVAACACALAAWKWHHKQPGWLHPSEPPHHPFDYAC